MKKLLFIDRDGTLIIEPPVTFQVDSFEVLQFYPEVLYWLKKIATETAYELVMVTNQDGLGTTSFPEESFWPIQHFIMRTLEAENIFFKEVLIDKSFENENSPNRKPAIGMLIPYLNNKDYDIPNSLVIGDRLTDVQLAKNLGCKAIYITNQDNNATAVDLPIILKTSKWEDIYKWLILEQRFIKHERHTNETKINITLNLDGTGNSNINTGLHFFNHMLEQLSRHSGIDIEINVVGDLHIDEHHTIEDTAIALGESLLKALGNKYGIERYGYSLPMDDCLAQVAIDFGGRPWIVWEANFSREKIGDMPTEMFYHFFKSLTDAAKINLNIKAEGQNEHHKIESIFKALAKSIKMAIKRDANNMQLPSTKGVL